MKRSFLIASAAALTASPAAAQHAGQDMTMPMPPEKAPASPGEPMTMDHSAMGHEGHGMTGAYGPYTSDREASGTAWQPDSSEHGGLHIPLGEWSLMLHGTANLVYEWQEAPRGDEKAFLAGHLITTLRRLLGNGTLQFRSILSPDALFGKRGYPLLLASGETADGTTRLIDRQHPHDLFGELSASYSLNLSPNDSLFVYAGLPGEPAFGPPVYLHRRAIQDSPEAPITHHWLDSTHASFGVVTAGVVHGNVKLEASRFNGREPDQHRFDSETGPLDSTAVRLSWNPIRDLSLQGSWAHLKEPEQLEPGVDQRRLSASALYTRRLSPDTVWASTLAWGRRSQEGRHFNAYALESGLTWKDWTLFGRGEITENNELVAGLGEDAPAYRVGKASLGLIRDFRLAPHIKVGIGGLYARNFVPRALEPAYGGDPSGAMGFIRFKLD